MEKIIWTDLAIGDLRSIYEYVAQDSVSNANRLVDQLVESVDILEDFPLAGRPVPEIDIATIREVIRGNYRIIYLVGEGLIQVLRVHHAARLLTEDDL